MCWLYVVHALVIMFVCFNVVWMWVSFVFMRCSCVMCYACDLFNEFHVLFICQSFAIAEHVLFRECACVVYMVFMCYLCCSRFVYMCFMRC